MNPVAKVKTIQLVPKKNTPMAQTAGSGLSEIQLDEIARIRTRLAGMGCEFAIRLPITGETFGSLEVKPPVVPKKWKKLYDYTSLEIKENLGKLKSGQFCEFVAPPGVPLTALSGCLAGHCRKFFGPKQAKTKIVEARNSVQVLVL